MARGRRGDRRIETLDQGKPFQLAVGGDVPVGGRTSSTTCRATRRRSRARSSRSPPPATSTPTPRASRSGVVGLIVPWNFPLVDRVVEGRPGPGGRQHRGAQARRDDAAVGAAPGRAGPRGRLPAGRPQRRHRLRRPTPARPSRAPGRRQDLVHGIDGDRPPRSSTPPKSNFKRLTLELGGKSANISSPTPISTRPSPARGRHLLQRRPGLRRRVASVRPRGRLRRRRRGHRREARRASRSETASTRRARSARWRAWSTSIGSAATSERGRRGCGDGRDGRRTSRRQGLLRRSHVFAEGEPVAADRRARRSSARSSWRSKFTDEAEVLASANDSQYGLAGAIWTKRRQLRAHRVASQVRTGTMWVNSLRRLRPGPPVRRVLSSPAGAARWDTRC